MNACNMVIINGIDQVCPYTFQNVNLKSKTKKNNKNKQGFSVIDYIVMSENILSTNKEEGKEEKQNVKYVQNSFKVWNEKFADISDHKLISCKIQLTEENFENKQESIEEQEQEQEQEQKVKWRRKDKGDRKFWKKLEEVGDVIMDQWLAEQKHSK